MVRGLDVFKNYFERFQNNYVIIGGTACDIIIAEAGLIPRATKDIDIILVVEALSSDFVKQFWQFIQDGNYDRREKSGDKRKCYRFIKPENKDFPLQIELFSRTPDLIELDKDAHLTPIPVDDEMSNLSAILLSDDYYSYMIEHSSVDKDVHYANIEALICLKAKAYLEIVERISKGSDEDKKQFRKHKADVFRLAVMLRENDVFELPDSIRDHMQAFVDSISDDLPANVIFNEMGLGNINVDNVYKQIVKSFKIN